jgi:ribonuclease VapC
VVVDTSALVAMLAEADGHRYFEVLQLQVSVAMSAVNVYETRLVLLNRARFAPDILQRFLHWLILQEVEIAPFDADQASLAHDAYLRFGKGFHPAALNFADCAAHALAKARGEPLLFKGEDFARTDVRAALGPA